MKLIPASLLLTALCALGSAHAAPVQTPHVTADLIAENTALTPGNNNTIALRLTPEQDWHVYWINPGDSGLATKLKWTLPAGYAAGEIQWPYPHMQNLGTLTNYGYGEDTLHLVQLTVPADAKGSADLKAEAKWLVCKDVCIPGSAQLALTLPVAASEQPDERWAKLFAETRAKIPAPVPYWPASFETANGDLSLSVSNPPLNPKEAKEMDEPGPPVNPTVAPPVPSGGRFEFFPIANDLVNHNAPQRIITKPGSLRISQKLSEYFVSAPTKVEGVLVWHDSDGNTFAFFIEATPGKVEPVPATTSPAGNTPAGAGSTDNSLAGTSLPLILAFAILGGLILNLMPCVFPVLSLKALAVMQSRDQSSAQQRSHALAYTAGVMLSCVGVALLLIVLRETGAAIGWGFQLQSPVFVAALAYLMFALGLSMSGLFEIGTSWMGAGQSLASKSGLAGSFFTGVLATVVASPCTAPFMGTALGYAITQPLAVSLLVFLALGLGLALPFLLLGFFPRLAAFLPRPGAWMETFKQAMAFPLYLTVVWLVWVLSRQTGIDGGAVVLSGLVLIAFAVWLLRHTSAIAQGLRYATLILAAALLFGPRLDAQAPTASAEAHDAWAADKVAALRAEGRTIFVNFTADWCITCKVNEKGALDSARVHQAFETEKVAWLTGDWTRPDPAITAELAKFGRNGVPLYLVYTKGAEPKVLPQVLTPDTVIDALKE